MRVVVPFAGSVHPDTRSALDSWPGVVEYRDVGSDDYAYGRLLRELWADAQDVLIVEHDVVPTPLHLAAMAGCHNVYCAGVYPWTTAIGPALGFTRFRSLLMRTYPHVMEIAARIPSNYGRPGFWKQMDVWAMGAVLRDLYGLQPCCHLPPLEHRNPDRQAINGAPLLIRVEGRMHLEPGLVERIAAEVASDAQGRISPIKSPRDASTSGGMAEPN